jgi:hypothetical protein
MLFAGLLELCKRMLAVIAEFGKLAMRERKIRIRDDRLLHCNRGWLSSKHRP